MANAEHLKILRQGLATWNQWRRDNPHEMPDLCGAELSRAPLFGINLSSANLTDADLGRADLSGGNLSGAYLIEAYLRGANLFGANLVGAYLCGADLVEASLSTANLSGADLSGANLSAADLDATDLSGATLNYATFGYTTLADLDLSSVIGLETAEHEAPSSISVDTLYRSHGAIPEEFLRGVGLPDTFIQYLPSLIEQPIQYYSCFISYSHRDKEFARRLHDALQGRGIRCWLDEHQIKAGQKIHVEVDRGIRLWDKVLLCCSEHSLKSLWVNNEIELAIQKEQRLYKNRGEEVLTLIPLNLDGYMFKGEWNSGWKGQITGRLAPDFTGWKRSHKKFEQQLERVVKALRADAAARDIPPQPKL